MGDLSSCMSAFFDKLEADKRIPILTTRNEHVK